AGLRDRLKTALSGTPAEGEPTAAELAEKIKMLKASQVIEPPAPRVRDKQRAEMVRRRMEPVKEEPLPVPEPKAMIVEVPKPDEDDTEERPSFRQAVRKGVQ